jgi:hypothetical protein
MGMFRTFFVTLADLDDLVNVLLLECSGDNDEVVLSLLVTNRANWQCYSPPPQKDNLAR